MGTLRARLLLVLAIILASPVAALAGGKGEETMWDWIVRFLSWAAGGWHLY